MTPRSSNPLAGRCRYRELCETPTPARLYRTGWACPDHAPPPTPPPPPGTTYAERQARKQAARKGPARPNDKPSHLRLVK